MSNAATTNAIALPKALVREVLDRMPENASFQEIVDEIRLLIALEESAQEIRDGKGIPQSEAMERTRRWLSQ
jgi:hypothetical protein